MTEPNTITADGAPADRPPAGRTLGAQWLNILLAISQFVLLCILVFGVLWLVITVPVWFPGAPRIPLPLSVAVDPGSSLLEVAPDALPLDSVHIEDWRGDLEVRFTNPWHQWLYIFFGLQIVALVMFSLRYTRHFVAAVAEGRMLTLDNARRLRNAGILVIVASIYAPGAASLLSHWVITGVEAEGARLLVDWSGELRSGDLTTGWLILIIAEALRRGAVLEEEQSLTV